MPIATSGGALAVSSSSIIDGTITDDDINAAANINPTKIAGLVGDPGDYLSFDSTATATISVTTIAGTRLLIFGFVTTNTNGLTGNVYLKYNGVTKAQAVSTNASAKVTSTPLFYTEVPGAGTHDITVSVDGGLSISSQQICVIKLQTA